MEKIMSKPEWGIKRLCPSCGIKYYDFNKETIKCPKCEFEFDPDLLLKSRKGRGVSSKVEEEGVTSNEKEENETLQENIATLDNDQEMLEIDESDATSEIDNDDMEVNLNDSIEGDEINIIEEDDDKDDNFSLEIEENKDDNDDK